MSRRCDHLNMDEYLLRAREFAARGENSGSAKLTDEIVRDIRARWIPKGRGKRHHEGPSIRQLAREYGVTYSAMWRICSREGWIHVREAA